jgi:hypothetical protein
MGKGVHKRGTGAAGRVDFDAGTARISEGLGIALEVLPPEDGKPAEAFDGLDVWRQTTQRIVISGQPSCML